MVNGRQTLEMHLADWRQAGGRDDVAVTVMAMAIAARQLAATIALGPLLTGGAQSGEEQQAQLTRTAEDLFGDSLAQSPVALVAKVDQERAAVLDAGRPLAVALFPLDGSAPIETNLATATIFSIFPVPTSGPGGNDTALLLPGREQLAAGFFIYGPQTALVLTLRQGTHVFTLDARDGHFYLTRDNVQIPQAGTEYAINASNYRRWPQAVREYIDDLVAGAEGPRGKDFNMRWIAAMVSEAFRIMVRGGICLYPRDTRKGFENGRIRLVFEANPIALVFEQAGGAATDGVNRILDLVPTSLNQRTPLVFGSADKVARVQRYYNDAPAREQSSPLFKERGLFRV